MRKDWGGDVRRGEIRQGMMGVLFCKDLSRSNGKAFKDFKLAYDLMRSAFLNVLFAYSLA